MDQTSSIQSGQGKSTYDVQMMSHFPGTSLLDFDIQITSTPDPLLPPGHSTPKMVSQRFGDMGHMEVCFLMRILRDIFPLALEKSREEQCVFDAETCIDWPEMANLEQAHKASETLHHLGKFARLWLEHHEPWRLLRKMCQTVFLSPKDTHTDAKIPATERAYRLVDAAVFVQTCCPSGGLEWTVPHLPRVKFVLRGDFHNGDGDEGDSSGSAAEEHMLRRTARSAYMPVFFGRADDLETARIPGQCFLRCGDGDVADRWSLAQIQKHLDSALEASRAAVERQDRERRGRPL